MSAAASNSDIKMHHLIYFIQAATSGSLVNAADVLHVSQPAVSKAIGDLESILGVPLFRRRPTGMQLTGYGETFLRHAIAARANIAEAVVSINDMKDTKRGHVRVGVVPMDALPFFHQGIVALKTQRPNIVVSIITGSNERLLPDLKIGGLDFVIGRAADEAMMAELTHEPLFGERMALVVWPSNPLAVRDELRLADLLESPWLVPLPNTVLRERLHEEFAKRKVSFPSNIVEGGVSMVLGSLPDSPRAIVVCPHSLVEHRIAAGRLVELDVDIDKELAPTGITRRKDSQSSKSAALLLEELRRAGHERAGPVLAAAAPRPPDVSTRTG